MSKFEVGDLVKGLPESNKYGITNENMTKGVVREVTEGGIVVRVLISIHAPTKGATAILSKNLSIFWIKSTN